MKKSTILLAVVVLSVLPGCSTTSVPEVESAFCADLRAVQAASTDLQAITTTSTVEELQAARADLDAAMSALSETAVEMREVKLDNINAAYAAVGDMVNSISDEATLAAAANQVVVAAGEVLAAYDELNNVACVVAEPQQ